MKKLGIILLLGLILSWVFFQKEFITHLKTSVLILEEFPQSKLKPLSVFTSKPKHEKFKIPSPNGDIVADIFIPKGDRLPALVFVTGVKIAGQDKPNLLKHAENIARAGYVVVWPRLKPLDQGINLPESPETFVLIFKHLEKHPRVDPQRISFLGLSAGAATSFVSATHPDIKDKLHSFIFFGGYYDALAYLKSVATHKVYLDGKEITWKPFHESLYYTRENLKSKKAEKLLTALNNSFENFSAEALPQHEKDLLLNIDPSQHITNFKTPTFIIHSTTDNRVPYTESVKLSQALPDNLEKSFLVTDLFDHNQPKGDLKFGLKVARDAVSFYKFFYDLIGFL